MVKYHIKVVTLGCEMEPHTGLCTGHGACLGFSLPLRLSPIGSFRMRAGHRKGQARMMGLELSGPPHPLLKGGEKPEVKSNHQQLMI